MSEAYKTEFEQLNKLYAEIINGTKNTIKLMRLMGDILNLIKKKEGHGNWIPWFEKHKDELGFSLSWANRCMKVSREWHRIPKDANGEPDYATATRVVESLRVKTSSLKKDDRADPSMKDEISRLREIHRRLRDNQTDNIDAQDYDQAGKDDARVVAWLDDIKHLLERLATERKWGPRTIVREDGSCDPIVRLEKLHEEMEAALRQESTPAAELVNTLAQAATRLSKPEWKLRDLIDKGQFAKLGTIDPDAITESQLVAMARELNVQLAPPVPSAKAA